VISGLLAAAICIPGMLIVAWLYEPTLLIAVLVNFGRLLLRALVCWPCHLYVCLGTLLDRDECLDRILGGCLRACGCHIAFVTVTDSPPRPIPRASRRENADARVTPGATVGAPLATTGMRLHRLTDRTPSDNLTSPHTTPSSRRAVLGAYSLRHAPGTLCSQTTSEGPSLSLAAAAEAPQECPVGSPPTGRRLPACVTHATDELPGGALLSPSLLAQLDEDTLATITVIRRDARRAPPSLAWQGALPVPKDSTAGHAHRQPQRSSHSRAPLASTAERVTLSEGTSALTGRRLSLTTKCDRQDNEAAPTIASPPPSPPQLKPALNPTNTSEPHRPMAPAAPRRQLTRLLRQAVASVPERHFSHASLSEHMLGQSLTRSIANRNCPAVARILFGWLTNLIVFFGLLLTFALYGCELFGAQTTANASWQALLLSWAFSIFQRFVVNEPCLILISRGLPILFTSEFCATVCGETIVNILDLTVQGLVALMKALKTG